MYPLELCDPDQKTTGNLEGWLSHLVQVRPPDMRRLDTDIRCTFWLHRGWFHTRKSGCLADSDKRYHAIPPTAREVTKTNSPDDQGVAHEARVVEAALASTRVVISHGLRHASHVFLGVHGAPHRTTEHTDLQKEGRNVCCVWWAGGRGGGGKGRESEKPCRRW